MSAPFESVKFQSPSAIDRPPKRRFFCACVKRTSPFFICLPYAYLKGVLERLPAQKQNRLHELLP
ncbi:transposase domain-containing protein [Halomonas halodenitrificans]|uniref:transposase domain-containing protein n=1 Tax=Halomonas halodenitrificans TaxID=28252 RepID=UPI003CCC3BD0